MAETTSLLNWRTGNRTGGSNPPLTAGRYEVGSLLLPAFLFYRNRIIEGDENRSGGRGSNREGEGRDRVGLLATSKLYKNSMKVAKFTGKWGRRATILGGLTIAFDIADKRIKNEAAQGKGNHGLPLDLQFNY